MIFGELPSAVENSCHEKSFGVSSRSLCRAIFPPIHNRHIQFRHDTAINGLLIFQAGSSPRLCAHLPFPGCLYQGGSRYFAREEAETVGGSRSDAISMCQGERRECVDFYSLNLTSCPEEQYGLQSHPLLKQGCTESRGLRGGKRLLTMP